MHCKDVRPDVIRLARNRDWSFLESVLNGAFTVPGDGAIDFAAVIGILRDAGYRGWLVVEAEQDPAVAPAYRYAEIGVSTAVGAVAGNRRRGTRCGEIRAMSLTRHVVKAATQRPRRSSTRDAAVGGLAYVGFEALSARARRNLDVGSTGAASSASSSSRGRVTVESGELAWRELGERASPFEDVAPYAVVPAARARTCAITARDGCRDRLSQRARRRTACAPRLIEPAAHEAHRARAAARTRATCATSCRRTRACRARCWSSRSSRRRATRRAIRRTSTTPTTIPAESSLEETYYHRLDPPQGFAFQRVYTDDRSLDEAMTVEDRDVVMVPRGYHPVVVPHGYDVVLPQRDGRPAARRGTSTTIPRTHGCSRTSK